MLRAVYHSYINIERMIVHAVPIEFNVQTEVC